MWRQKPRPLLNHTLLYQHLKIIWALPAPSESVILSVRCRSGCFPPHGAEHRRSPLRWSMSALPVTYADNVCAMKPRPLRELIWRASSRDIERALFGDASSFLPGRDIHIPKFPPSCVSALCRPGDLSHPHHPTQSSPTWLAHQAGQWVVAVYTAITQKPLSMSCN